MKDIEEILDIDPVDITAEPEEMVDTAKNALTTFKKNYAVVFNEEHMDDRFTEDFEIVRESLKNMIQNISDSILKLSLIAADTEKAAHFTALSQMMTVMLNSNKQLLEIYSEKKRYMRPPDKFEPTSNSGAINIDKAIFTGTTSELLKLIRNNNTVEHEE